MIKTVIFDIGGVLIRTEDYSHRRAWERKLGLADWESEQIVFNSEMGTKAQSGGITDAELWAWVDERLALGEQFDAFRQAFWAGDVLDTELVDFIRRLRGKYQTAVISNATDALLYTLGEQHKIADAFDLIVGSAEEKIMKPAPIIYQRTLARLGREPHEAVFIDDFAHNIVAAREVGMHAIHFTPGIDLPAALAELGVDLS